MFQVIAVYDGGQSVLGTREPTLDQAMTVAEEFYELNSGADYIEVADLATRTVVFSKWPTFQCADCKRDVPWWYGADDQHYDCCDSCWGVREGLGPDSPAERIAPLEPGTWEFLRQKGVIVGG